jgi:hypothetical protein
MLALYGRSAAVAAGLNFPAEDYESEPQPATGG